MSSASTETIQVGALSVRFLVEAADSNGSASVFECFVPADSKMPAPHSHDAFEETIYGLEGTTTWTVDGRTLEIGPGDALCIPRGGVHGFDNHGTEDAKFLAISSPGLMTPDYFREIHQVLASTPGGPAGHGEGRGSHAPARPNAGATAQLTALPSIDQLHEQALVPSGHRRVAVVARHDARAPETDALLPAKWRPLRPVPLSAA
jgi:quercetin dioxygenase-like cupin family protein